LVIGGECSEELVGRMALGVVGVVVLTVDGQVA
jgi:hypothetical protein